MSAPGLGLGRVFNVVFAASGVHIPLTNAEAVSFVSWMDAGTQSITLKESIDGASEANLAVISTLYKQPGVGGTWTAVTQAAAATYDHTTDATNDCFTFTVRGDQLSDGFNCVEVTQVGAASQLVAIIHDLKVSRKPANLATNVDV